MIEVSIIQIIEVILLSITLGMVISLSIRELSSKRVESYRKKYFQKKLTKDLES